jgi:hypothetical protein
VNLDWQADWIDCQRVADLAGADHRAETVPDSGAVRYCRTHFVGKNLDALARGGPCVLLSSFSDASVTDTVAAALPANVLRWFSNNVDTASPRVEALPIGFISSADMLGCLVKQARQPRPPAKAALYVNFCKHHKAYGPMADRLNTWYHFARPAWRDWVLTAHQVPPEKFYADIAACDYVLSPPGAGPDCHRHWEAIALGSIPVVKRSRAMKVLDDMPALLVDDWAEVTPERLAAERPVLAARFDAPAMHKLTLGYWRERIAACA